MSITLADAKRWWRKAGRVLATIAGDERGRYVVAERAAARLHPGAILSEKDRAWLEDPSFRATYARLDAAHPRRVDRAWNLKEFARWTRDVPGDTAECGVLEGVASYFICAEHTGTGKTHHAFDSFEGLSTPDDRDGSYWAAGDLGVAESVARANLSDFPRVVFHKGWIPDQFDTVQEATFSLVHVDVDLYQPTYDSLAFFVPRMSPGGLVVLDDYGFTTCPGARAAADEVCAAHGLRIIELSSGQGLVVV